MIDALLQQAQLVAGELDGVAFGAGPGSFTGLRIACGIAQGLALGAEAPVAAVGTLECLAQACGAERVIAALDARMGEVYIGAYERVADGWCAVAGPLLCTPQHAPTLEGRWVGCGGGFAAYREALGERYAGQLETVRPEIYAHAREVAVLGARLLARGGGVDPAQAAPVYLRDQVALSSAERARRKSHADAGRT